MTTHRKPEEEKRSHHKKAASEPEAADEGSGQASESAAPMAAEGSAGGLSDETAEETAARDKAVRAQVQDFVENLPPGAEEGLYSATAHDRWSNGPYQPDIPDGTYLVAESDWFVSFRAGRLYSARHRSRIDPEHEPEALTEIPANGA